jgi:uncharacterized membrane protein
MIHGFVRDAYAPALLAHTSAGVAALLSGASALLFRKGERAHRLAGRVFFISMLIIGASGPLIAESRVSFLAPLLALYFVATGWRSARRGEAPAGGAGGVEVAFMAFATGLALLFFLFGRMAAASPTGQLDGFPASFHYVFAGVAAFAALTDGYVVWRRAPIWERWISRHLWRMNFALLFAGASFFIGQADRHPEFVRDSGVLAPIALAPLGFLLFWLVRVRLFRGVKIGAPLAAPGRLIGLLYLLVIAAGLLALFRPKGF